MTIRLRLLIGFFILILVFLVDFMINQRLSRQVLTNTTYLNNSETVIRNSNVIHKEMIEMQSGFRGFLLTEQKSFLQPYYEGLSSIPPLILEQQSLISSAKQREKLDTIYSLHKRWVSYANSLITSKLDTIPASKEEYQQLFNNKLKMEVGKKLNDRIGSWFTFFDDHEYMLRLERRKALQESITRTREISLILTVFSILLAVLLSFYLVRMITGRISKMVNLAEKISAGNFIRIGEKENDEMSKLTSSLNQMSYTLEKNFNELTKKNNELDQFAYVVSHDLKAPLRGISNMIDWIEEDHTNELTEDVNNKLMVIKGRAKRLENMINGLLEYARVEKMKKGAEQIELDSLLKDLIDLLVPPGINVQLEKKLPRIFAEKIHIEQVFSNLISNAVKYNNGENPEIKIGCTETDDYYKFFVSDNGPGIESQYFDKIFVIFQTLKERDAFESTGVGLAIAKKVVEDNKGKIYVESKIGQGTTFYFTWPKKQTNGKQKDIAY